jgi:hypothetical protein
LQQSVLDLIMLPRGPLVIAPVYFNGQRVIREKEIDNSVPS